MESFAPPTWPSAAAVPAPSPGTVAEGKQRALPPSPAPTRVYGPGSLRRRLMVADAVAIGVGMMLAFGSQALLRPVPHHIQLDHLLLSMLSAPFWFGALAAKRTFAARAVERPTEEVGRLMSASAIGLGAMVAVAFALKYSNLSRFWVASVYVFVTLVLLVERALARAAFNRLRSSGRISRRIVIIGTDAHAIGMMHSLQRNPHLGYLVVGFLGDDDLGERGGCSVLGPIDDAERIMSEHECTGAMVSLASVEPAVVNRLARQLTDAGLHVALSSTLRDIDVTRMRPQAIDGRTLIYIEPTVRDGWRGRGKRVFDVAAALAVLALTAPFVAIAALAIKIESPGPVLFRQERVGLGGRRFRIMKLRTMVDGAESQLDDLRELNEMDGPLFKISDDPRVTRVGRVLRKLSIDEIPQCWNVVRGEMSVVGPRPALPSEVARWDAEVHERLRVLPGITGLWQVSGRSGTSFEDYKRLDLYYVDNWSIFHDVRIVLRTITAVVLQRGAS